MKKILLFAFLVLFMILGHTQTQAEQYVGKYSYLPGMYSDFVYVLQIRLENDCLAMSLEKVYSAMEEEAEEEGYEAPASTPKEWKTLQCMEKIVEGEKKFLVFGKTEKGTEYELKVDDFYENKVMMLMLPEGNFNRKDY